MNLNVVYVCLLIILCMRLIICLCSVLFVLLSVSARMYACIHAYTLEQENVSVGADLHLCARAHQC